MKSLWRPVDCFESSLVKEQYLSPAQDQATDIEDRNLLKMLQLSRLKSTYQVDYCKEPKKPGEESEELEDVFLKEMEQYYSASKKKVLPPLSTTRRVFAYGRPAFFQTGLSEYKDRICREGYKIFKKDKDAGIVRLSRSKRVPSGRQKARKSEAPPSPPLLQSPDLQNTDEMRAPCFCRST
ncbi:hypothetical protein C0J52_12012 [Blattella germanica]|nr:hypothetical protein C0J52_12012 [Blattella germanica]